MNDQNVSEGIKAGVFFLSLGNAAVSVPGKLSDGSLGPLCQREQWRKAGDKPPRFTRSSQDDPRIKLNKL